MITGNVRNFRRLVKADIVCAPIALAAGLNNQGKTSLVQAFQAVLTGQALALFGLTKKDADVLVHDGAEKAQVRISAGDDGGVQMEWPECRLISLPGDKPPQASVFAAGLSSIATMTKAEERAKALESYLKSTPAREDLAAELGEVFTEAVGTEERASRDLDRLWKRIETDGWDAVHAEQVTRRRDAGRDWEKITGERFGSDKAPRWQPKEWRLGLEETEEEELARRLQAANTRLEQAIRAEAAGGAEIARLQELARDAGIRKNGHAAAAALLAAAGAALTKAHAALEAIPVIPEAATVACPHQECKRPILIRQPNRATIILEKPPEIPGDRSKQAEAIKAMRLQRADAEIVVEQCQTAKSAATRAFQDADRALEEALQAELALEAAKSKPKSDISVAVAREHQETARNDLALWRKFTEAEKLANLWLLLDRVIKVLAPTGLRQTKLAQAIELFNRSQLAPLCEVARWEPVAITEDLGVTYGGRPFSQLSESWQFRAGVILQVAMALLDGSSMVVIDRIDRMDDDGRNGLFTLLVHVRLPALVTMMARSQKERSQKGRIPDLSEKGLGASYWITDGVTQLIAEKAAAA
jgi:hypothetical protein